MATTLTKPETLFGKRVRRQEDPRLDADPRRDGREHRDEEQRVLAAGSVAGLEFTATVVAAGLATDIAQVEAWCEGVARRGHFLRNQGDNVWPDGTVTAPCGHCTWCLSNRSLLRLPPRPAVGIDDTLWHQVTLLRREQPDPLVDPWALARFLCGLTSPKLTRHRLTAHQLFGALAHAPFTTVLQRATHDS